MEHLPKNIHRSLFKNVVSQVGGRLFLSAARLAIAAIIVRYAGVARFGEYSLLLSLVLIGEWVVDFGLTEISVRNICQQPKQDMAILKTITQARLLQALMAFGVLWAILYGRGYPGHIVKAGGIAAISLFFYAGALIYRSLFRVRMRMELDVFSEATGVLVTMPVIWYACQSDASVDILMACYMAARLVFLLMALLLGRRDFKLSVTGVTWPAVTGIFREAMPLGVAGLLVSVYDNLAPIMLADLATVQDVGYFSSAIRFVFPIVIVIQSINGAFFPILSSYWQKPGTAFADTQQAALDGSMLVSAGLFCSINSSAEFLMGLIGPDMQQASGLLQLLSWVIIARAASTSMSPLIIIAGAQNKMVWLAAISLAFQFVALRWAIPLYGVRGAAVAYLVGELAISLGPIILLSQHLARIKLDWRITARTVLSAIFALQSCQYLQLSGSLSGGIYSFFAYAFFAVILKAVSLKKLYRIAGTVRLQPTTTKLVD